MVVAEHHSSKQSSQGSNIRHTRTDMFPRRSLDLMFRGEADLPLSQVWQYHQKIDFSEFITEIPRSLLSGLSRPKDRTTFFNGFFSRPFNNLLSSIATAVAVRKLWLNVMAVVN